MAKKALITGVLGQDGGYLAKLLLEKGYEVYGGVRRSSSLNVTRLEELGIVDQVRLEPMDLLELTNMIRVVQRIRPDEIYNLAAQSYVGVSFEQPLLTSDIDGMGAARLLEVVRTVCPEARFYQASTSEMFGHVRETPQTELTPFHPRSPYGVAKAFAHYMTLNYREAHGLFACSGILFNHESPLRGTDFVTRKITINLAQIKHGQREVLELGNMDSLRDWGLAPEYVHGMWMMLQQKEADDYVLATGENHSVQEFVTLAAEVAGMPVTWEGEGEKLVGRNPAGKIMVRVRPEFYRPSEVEVLLGDPSKAQRKMGWRSETTFPQLVEMMMKADLERVSKGGLA